MGKHENLRAEAVGAVREYRKALSFQVGERVRVSVYNCFGVVHRPRSSFGMAVVLLHETHLYVEVPDEWLERI